ncbi:MAG: hypothetical protein ACKPJD_09775 [Planctomycetaceae bacterium]|jgi:hypothetical protein
MLQSAAAVQRTESLSEIRTLEQLRHFVHVQLCRRENLLEYQFPMTELEIQQSGRRCGVQFLLHGPRSVRLAAVWAEAVNELLFYDATGRRFNRIRLPHRIVSC